jgi:hypothetical protein
VNGPDRLGRFQSRGPNVVDSTIITTSYPINGMGNARRISYNGTLLGSTAAAFPAAC